MPICYFGMTWGTDEMPRNLLTRVGRTLSCRALDRIRHWQCNLNFRTWRHQSILSRLLGWWVSDSSVGMWIVSVVSRCHQYSCCPFCSLRCLIESLARYRNNNSLYVRACARGSFWSRVYITCQGWPQLGSRRRSFKVQVFGNAAERDRCFKILYRVRHKSVNTPVRHTSVNTPSSPERHVVRTWLAVYSGWG